MEGLSLFPDDFNWQTVSKLSTESNSIQMEYIKKYAGAILTNLKASVCVGESYYDIKFGNEIDEASKELLMRDLAKRFPHRVEFYDKDLLTYEAFESDDIFPRKSLFRINLQ